MQTELYFSLLELLFFFFFFLHAGKWLLAVLVTTSGWHSEPGNQVVGKPGGSAPNGLLEIIPKLSMNYPPELRHSSQALSIDGNGKKGECWTECVRVCTLSGRFGWSEQCWCLSWSVCISVCVCAL